ncbi:hypothetical protein O7623_23730 [Solwaraspora sp. WMMD791]|uniref:DivIVA domain-containing protein n=1 Tax=Solwaraspora sp. WMMD791 TaxID=3016086 RepID=UPI00249A5537|nr:hypothetical protein [Solwaraspora sp. WMMD791]WFE30871.1 hypothetical protein O7623_23730 [Solwaraspora sp. WMMD791]
MRRSATAAGMVFGIGVGVVTGPFLGDAALWVGVVIAALGVALSVAGPTDDRYLTGTGSRPPGHDGQQFALGGLGTRVEQILRLAEEQADDHRREATREAEAILSAARQEAAATLHRAHEQATRTTGREESGHGES